MKKVDLLEELKENSKQQREMLALGNAERGVDISEIKGLLEYKTLEDSFILNNLGVNSMNMKLQENKGKLIEMEKIEHATKHTVIHVDEIKRLCMKYRLRFLQTQNYVGVIPSDIVQNIREFETAKRESNSKFNRFDEHQLKTEFYIMAPGKMFNLKEREKEVDSPGVFKRFTSGFADYFQDPILFYKESDNHYVFMRKWGNDFTILRMLLGFTMKNSLNFFITALIASIVLSIGVYFLATLQLSIISLLVLICLTGIITNMLSEEEVFSADNWRSLTK